MDIETFEQDWATRQHRRAEIQICNHLISLKAYTEEKRIRCKVCGGYKQHDGSWVDEEGSIIPTGGDCSPQEGVEVSQDLDHPVEESGEGA